MSALKAMFTLAHANGKVYKKLNTGQKLLESDGARGFFKREQYLRVRDALPEHARVVLAIGYWTGMRLGEIRRLKWEQVRRRNGVWTIRLMRRQTKTMKARTIPVTPELGGVLDEAHARRHPGFEFVCFARHTRGQGRAARDFRKVWHTACVKIQLSAWVDRETGERFLKKPRGPGREVRGHAFPRPAPHGGPQPGPRGSSEKVAMTISGHVTRDIFERYKHRVGRRPRRRGREAAGTRGRDKRRDNGNSAPSPTNERRRVTLSPQQVSSRW